MKVSFDFDETLTEDGVWQYALELIDRGVEVWIVTARMDDKTLNREYGSFFKKFPEQKTGWLDNTDIFEMAEALGIPKNQIVFTNLAGKGTTFFSKNNDFIWHLDDAPKQLWDIKMKSSVIPISVLNPIWKSKCEQEIRGADTQNYLKKSGT